MLEQPESYHRENSTGHFYTPSHFGYRIEHEMILNSHHGGIDADKVGARRWPWPFADPYKELTRARSDTLYTCGPEMCIERLYKSLPRQQCYVSISFPRGLLLNIQSFHLFAGN
jgi:hypothetical protein